MYSTQHSEERKREKNARDGATRAMLPGVGVEEEPKQGQRPGPPPCSGSMPAVPMLQVPALRAGVPMLQIPGSSSVPGPADGSLTGRRTAIEALQSARSARSEGGSRTARTLLKPSTEGAAMVTPRGHGDADERSDRAAERDAPPTSRRRLPSARDAVANSTNVEGGSTQATLADSSAAAARESSKAPQELAAHELFPPDARAAARGREAPPERTPRNVDRGLHRSTELPRDLAACLTSRSGERAAQKTFMSNLQTTLSQLKTPRELGTPTAVGEITSAHGGSASPVPMLQVPALRAGVPMLQIPGSSSVPGPADGSLTGRRTAIEALQSARSARSEGGSRTARTLLKPSTEGAAMVTPRGHGDADERSDRAAERDAPPTSRRRLPSARTALDSELAVATPAAEAVAESKATASQREGETPARSLPPVDVLGTDSSQPPTAAPVAAAAPDWFLNQDTGEIVSSEQVEATIVHALTHQPTTPLRLVPHVPPPAPAPSPCRPPPLQLPTGDGPSFPSSRPPSRPEPQPLSARSVYDQFLAATGLAPLAGTAQATAGRTGPAEPEGRRDAATIRAAASICAAACSAAANAEQPAAALISPCLPEGARPSAVSAMTSPGRPLPAGLGNLDALAPPMPLPKLIAALGLSHRDVCNMWCGGSRLWGHSTAASDYDLYIVHRSRDPALRVATKRLERPVPIDATLLHADEWAERLRRHSPYWLLLVTHPMPWMLRLDPSQLGFALTPQLLQQAMFSHSLREWTRVRRCFVSATPDVACGRTTLVHLLRSYVLALQLVNHGRVLDYRAAEPLRLELCGYASIEWIWWRDTFEPRLETLHKQLRDATRRAREVGA